jgi:hypothetical protein
MLGRRNKNEWLKGYALGVLVACVCLSHAAAAVTVVYETQGRVLFSFAVPDHWQVLTGFEVDPSMMTDGRTPKARIVSAIPRVEAERVMWTGLWAPPQVQRLDETADYLARVSPRLMADPHVTFREERVINGQQARIVSGTGIRDERELDFALVAIQIAVDRVAFAAFIGEPDAFDRHEDELIAMMNSISAVKSTMDEAGSGK